MTATCEEDEMHAYGRGQALGEASLMPQQRVGIRRGFDLKAIVGSDPAGYSMRRARNRNAMFMRSWTAIAPPRAEKGVMPN